MSIVAENVKQLESSYTAGGNETKNTSGHSLAVFQKVKPRLVLQASYATSHSRQMRTFVYTKTPT